MTKTIQGLIMVAVGILLAVGGIKWTNAANSLYATMPEVIVEDDFSLTVVPGDDMGDSSNIFFPAVMGIIGGIVWIFFGIAVFGDVSFPGAICMATGIMLIPIGILNFLGGLFDTGFVSDFTKEIQYPLPLLQYLFVYHRKISIFIFAAAAFVLICIGMGMGGITDSSSAKKAENK
jgi:hypothetical protein